MPVAASVREPKWLGARRPSRSARLPAHTVRQADAVVGVVPASSKPTAREREGAVVSMSQLSFAGIREVSSEAPVVRCNVAAMEPVCGR